MICRKLRARPKTTICPHKRGTALNTTRTSKNPSAALFFVAALATLALDQLTKLAIVANIPWERGNPTYHFDAPNTPISVIDKFLYIVHITNEGAAWGILSGQTYLLSSIALLALAAIWIFRSHLGFDKKLGQFALGIFAGGVLGNLSDRICYGHVIDFIDVHLPIINYRWPAFNIADCGITIGVIIYIIAVFLEERAQKKYKK